MKPLVSISVITYNHEKYLAECLQSILSQRGPFELEVVVGEDASTDGTRDILNQFAAAYPSIIRPLLHDQNVGPAENWQSVLDHCRGSFVAHLDGDDYMLPGKLERQVKHMAEHPDVALVFHNMQVLDSDAGRVVGNFTAASHQPIRSLDDLVRYGNLYGCGSMFFRAGVLGTERINTQTKWVVDWLFQMQIAKHGSIDYIPEVLGVYRRHGNSFTALEGERRDAVIADQLLAIATAEPWLRDKRSAELARARVYYGAGARALRARDYSAAKRFLRASRASGQWLGRGHQVLASVSWCPVAARFLISAAGRIGRKRPSIR